MLPINNNLCIEDDNYDNINNLNYGLSSLSIIEDKIEFNKTIDNLPISLIKIELLFCYDFNQKIDNLPLKLNKLLILSNNFNKKINKLPNSLKYISLSCRVFNKSIENLYFKNENIFLSLYSRYFNNNYNNLINKIKIIDFSFEVFNQPIDNIPNSINMLSISLNNFNQSLNNLPQSIIKLIFRSSIFNKNLNKISCKKLTTNVNLNVIKLSSSVKVLTYDSKEVITNLPNSIDTLIIQSNYLHSLELIPEGIKTIKFSKYNKNVINDLPLSVNEIWIHKDNEKYINSIYKHKIRYLKD